MHRSPVVSALALSSALIACGPSVSKAPVPAQPSVERPSPGSGAGSAQARAETALAPSSWHVKDGMVRIPAGPFTRGCNDDIDEDCEDDERPARAIELREFWIDRLEVSLYDYAECVEQGRCLPLKVGSCAVYDGTVFQKGIPLDPAYLDGALPVTCVSWKEARDYCHVQDKRLPSEAEWEKAARGIDRRRYPWGDWKPGCTEANVFECVGMPEAVGGHPFGASPYGVLDMAGNVWEWTEDWYGERYYRRSKRRNPQGPNGGRVRVVRGGSFYDDEFSTRSSYRYGITPHSRINILGFRCARTKAPRVRG